LGEIHGNGERRLFVPVVVPAAGQICSESFGIVEVGTGGVPASSLSSRDWIGSFVGDRVVAVALACHVSLHVGLLLLVVPRVSAVDDIGRYAGFLQFRP
jgi:ABC-type uncharacterized transport system permease subunit